MSMDTLETDHAFATDVDGSDISMLTVPAMLDAAAAAHPDRELVRVGGTAWTNADARRVARASAAHLRDEYGLRRGDTVVLMTGNRIEFLTILLGAATLGLVTAPINTAAKGEQLRHMLRNSAPSVAFVEPAYAVRVAAASEEAGTGTRTVVVGEQAIAEPAVGDPAASRDGAAARTERDGDAWRLPSDAASLPADVELDDPGIGPGDLFVILYTSGTTGVSKGVECPHAQYAWWAHHNIDLLGLEPRDVLLTSLPLFHTNALSTFFQALRSGATAVFQERFSASGWIGSVRDEAATVGYLLGAMVPILLTTPERPDDADNPLERILAPGVPAAAASAFAARFGVELIDGFATTESNFVIGSRAGEGRDGWMGVARPGFHVRVADEHDREVPPGTPGELLLRADHPYAFALGYHGMPEATVTAWRNLWLHTGDRVVRSEDGWFRFLDRMKDVIRRRGENISSYEVEQVLISHDAVEAVAAYPVPSELAEDEVMVSVVVPAGAELRPEDLLDHARGRLAYFAMPRYVDVVSALPLTENGKVRKFVLREQGVTETTWDRDAAGYEVRRDV